MSLSCRFHIPKTSTVTNLLFNRPAICAFHRLWLSTESEGGGESNLPEKGQYIPRRIRKRLEQKGLGIDDLEYRPEGRKSSYIELKQALENSVVDRRIEIDFPSDVERRKELRKQEKHAYRPPDIKPNETSILLFPGQGSQFVGMGKKLLPFPGVEDLYRKASEVLGYDLLKMCLGGPKDMLDKTLYCQPAVVVTSLAAMERLREEFPKALEKCTGMAGFSVGEITALIASEAISFEDGIHLINLRANAMQEASEAVPSGMLTVKCGHQTKLLSAMAAAKEYCKLRLGIEDPVCKIANYLCTNIKVVAGHEEALLFLEQYGQEWEVRNTKRLPVSGAFHTTIMSNGDKYWKYINAWKHVKLNKPKYRIHSNSDGKQLNFEEKNIGGIRNVISKQVARPVVWEQLMHILYTRAKEVPYPNTFEVGPGRQLGYLLRNTNAKAYEKYKNIEC